MRRRFHWFAAVLCLQAVWCVLSHADSFTTNIISGVSTNTGTYYILGNTGSSNYLEINTGGSLACTYAALGNSLAASNNTAMVTGLNSMLTASNGLYFESAGNSLIVSNGGVLNIPRDSYIGDGLGANGNQVLLNGTGSLWNSGSLVIGYYGTGNQVQILNGAEVLNTGGVILGTELSSNNILVVSGAGSRVMDSGRFFMGAGGPGNQFTLSDGASFLCAGAMIGGTGNVIVVTGTNTTWTNTGSIDLGYCCGVSNRLTISYGAVVSNTEAEIGNDGGGNTIIVDGAGTIWRNRELGFGVGPNNTLIVTNGATVYSSLNVHIGDGMGANNNMIVVTGTNTLWSNSGSLLVGSYGSGNRFLITDGARVLSNSFIEFATVSSNNSLTVAGPDSLLTDSGSLFMGSSGSANTLVVSSGAKLSCASATISYDNNDTVLITGSNTVWNNNGALTFASSGTNNQLVVSAGAVASNDDCYIGSSSSSRSNIVLVSGFGTTWNAGCINVGGSSWNSFIVSNDAIVNASCINISGGPSNQVVVTGTNTICNGGSITVGSPPGHDFLRIENGGQLLSGGTDAHVGGGFSSGALVTGQGSSWTGIGLLMVMPGSGGTQITIADNATVKASHMIVLAPQPSAPPGLPNNTGLSISSGGILIVTNATNEARIELQLGDTLLNQGVIIGNSLSISSQCQVTGCGTIVGNISNFGTLAVTCPGGTLTLAGIVTNNATITATNGADIEFLGPVVNNGTINVINGFVHFQSTFINHGFYADAASVLKTPNLSFNGLNSVISFGGVSGKTYAVEYTDNLMSSNWLALVGNILANGGNTQFTDTGAANLTQRFYRVHLILP